MKISRFLILKAFMLSSCALLAIGRIYDERLELGVVNIASLVSIVYFSSLFFMLLKIKKTSFTKSKTLFYFFFFFIIVMNPILWLYFDVTEYGFSKAINFCLIVIPISLIIVELYRYKDVLNTLYVLLGVVFFLAFIALVGLSITERTDGRMATLGGGPIVFGRWMGFGIISLIFLPLKIRSIYKHFLIVILFVLALSSGSRGPVFALFLTGLIYFLFNFKKSLFKIFATTSILFLVLFFSGLNKKISEIGNAERVFMNVSSKGISKQSTNTRKNLAYGSLILIKNYPFGVGSGNWQVLTNSLRPNHLMPLEYPHNIFLEIACEYGIHTLVIFLAMLFYAVNLSYKKMLFFKNNNSSLYPLFFYLLVFFFLNSQISGMLNDSRILFFIISCIIINKPLVSLNE